MAAFFIKNSMTVFIVMPGSLMAKPNQNQSLISQSFFSYCTVVLLMKDGLLTSCYKTLEPIFYFRYSLLVFKHTYKTPI